jgi:hypothetical protein
MRSSTAFVIHLIAKSDSNGHVKVVLDKLDNCMQLLHGHVKINSILITVTSGEEEQKEESESRDASDRAKHNEQLPISHIKLVYASTHEQLLEQIALENLLSMCNGPLEHDQFEWIGFFKTIEPLQSQCLIAGRRLVSVLNDIRNADLQGPPTRRQLHSQHRALCRALMDGDLQTLRRKGAITLTQLQEHMKRIRKRNAPCYAVTIKTKNFLGNDKRYSSYTDTNNAAGSHSNNHHHHHHHHHHRQSLNIYHKRNKSEPIGNADNNSCVAEVKQPASTNVNFVEQRLNGLITVFNEVDRAAKRLEQLTEHHRERLRELTRQRTLEDEINEVRTRPRDFILFSEH